MSTAIAGEVMGPRPGIAIVSFWQGIAAVGLRIATLVLAVLAFITACVAIGTINDMDKDYRDDVINEDEDDRPAIVNNPFPGVEAPNTPGIVDGSRGACGWIILLCLLAFIYQPLVIVLRFLNCGLVNLKISIFLVIDIVLSALFALGFFAGGISQAAFSAGWGEWQEYIEDIEDATGTDLDDFVDDNNLYFDRVQGAMAACAAFSLLAIPVFGLLLAWMILFLLYKWNQKVVNYTVKDAAPGFSE